MNYSESPKSSFSFPALDGRQSAIHSTPDGHGGTVWRVEPSLKGAAAGAAIGGRIGGAPGAVIGGVLGGILG